MKENIPQYILTAALLAVAVYLRSPIVCVGIIALWGITATQAIMTRKNRDADITEMMDTLQSHKAQMSLLTKDITNVAERARTILGENF